MKSPKSGLLGNCETQTPTLRKLTGDGDDLNPFSPAFHDVCNENENGKQSEEGKEE